MAFVGTIVAVSCFVLPVEKLAEVGFTLTPVTAIKTGVTVTALCPGATTSGFQAAANLGESKLVKGKKLPTSKDVAEYGYRAMMKGKAVAIHGFGNWLLAQSPRFAPRSWVVKVARKVQEETKK